MGHRDYRTLLRMRMDGGSVALEGGGGVKWTVEAAMNFFAGPPYTDPRMKAPHNWEPAQVLVEEIERLREELKEADNYRLTFEEHAEKWGQT